MNDLIFYGNKLILGTGEAFHASISYQSKFDTLHNGLYKIDLPVKSLIKINPNYFINPYYRFQPLYIHDPHAAITLSGIEVESYFFYRLNSYLKAFNKTQLSLKIQYANTAPWMVTAMNELGESEVAGKKANPRILEYFKSARFWGTDDTGGANAWCACFMSWVMDQHGYIAPQNAFRAKSWKNFGKSIKKPIYGAIGIKSRVGGGHVALVVGKSKDGQMLYMLGGNQDDEVNITKYNKNVWDHFVIPSDYDAKNDYLPIYDKAAHSAGREA